MKKTVILILMIIFFMIQYIQAKSSFYVSPGFTIGYNSARSFSFIPKISLGFGSSQIIAYGNITFGYNILTKKDNLAKSNLSNYTFLELQAGGNFIGVGYGVAWMEGKDGKRKACPKYSFCLGGLMYLNVDMIKTNDGLNYNVGIQFVGPIPFKRGMINF